MKRFQFRLSRLARVRRVQEEIARGRWLDAEYAARKMEEHLLVAQRELEEAFGHLRESQSRTQIDPPRILEFGKAIVRMETGRQSLEKRACAARLAADCAREPWQELRAAIEGLRRLKEKARLTHRIEGEHKAAQEIDQTASERSKRADPLHRTTP